MQFDIDQYYSRMNSGEVILAYKGSISSELITNVLEILVINSEDILPL